MPTLYTMGYLSNKAEKKINDLISLNIPIVDVRDNPTSKHWQWKKEALETKQGITYYWIGELGNVNHKQALTGQYTEERIKIRDMDNGIQQLGALLAKHKHVCILCACSSKVTCHRIIVAQEAKKRIAHLTVSHI